MYSTRPSASQTLRPQAAQAPRQEKKNCAPKSAPSLLQLLDDDQVNRLPIHHTPTYLRPSSSLPPLLQVAFPDVKNEESTKEECNVPFSA